MAVYVANSYSIENGFRSNFSYNNGRNNNDGNFIIILNKYNE